MATAALVFGAGPALAGDLLERHGLFGDWGGARPRLEQEGIDLSGDYIGEGVGNPIGGQGQGVRYAYQISLGATLHLDRLLADPEAGTFQVLVTQRAGRSLSADLIGNTLPVQTIYGPSQTVRLTELSYNRDFAGGLANVKLGRLYTQGDFTASPLYWGDAVYCNFLSNGICGRPSGLPLNSGFVSYPVSSWAARVRLSLTRETSLSVGAYEVNPSLRSSGHGFDLGTRGATGAFLPLELGVKAGQEDSLPGNYRIGAYYDTSTVRDAGSSVSRYIAPGTEVPDDFTRPRTGRHGFYVLTDQMIQRDSHSSPRGTVALLNLQYGDPRTSLVSWYGFAGLVRRGTFVGRDEDTASLGASTVSINKRIQDAAKVLQEMEVPAARAKREIVLETSYGAALTPWLNLRGGIQYILRPGGRADVADALVFDLRTSVRF